VTLPSSSISRMFVNTHLQGRAVLRQRRPVVHTLQQIHIDRAVGEEEREKRRLARMSTGNRVMALSSHGDR
jgi:hypothetical protein